MKLNLRQPPKPAPIPEFILTEQEARLVTEILGNTSFADHVKEIGVEFTSQEERDKASRFHYNLYDELVTALQTLE